jgi:hypothetical protein
MKKRTAPKSDPSMISRLGLEAFLFPLFLTGKAQSHTGDGLEAGFRDRLAAFTAARLAVNPFRAFLIGAGSGLAKGGLALDAFQFRSLIENIHVYIS